MIRKSKGDLWLIPTPINEGNTQVISEFLIHITTKLKYFITERARTTRRYLKNLDPHINIDSITFYEYDKHGTQDINSWLKPAELGHDVGLVSESGCPGIADPGAEVVMEAHKKGIRVRPMVGPTSIILALMSSGLNGQKFSFVGYLPRKLPLLRSRLKSLEQEILKTHSSQIFIETPYRNRSLVSAILDQIKGELYLNISCRLTAEDEFSRTLKIKDWKSSGIPNLEKKECIYVLGLAKSPR